MKMVALVISLLLLLQGIITAILVSKGKIKDCSANDILIVGCIFIGLLGLIGVLFS